jgi:hypothetical protein
MLGIRGECKRRIGGWRKLHEWSFIIYTQRHIL